MIKEVKNIDWEGKLRGALFSTIVLLLIFLVLLAFSTEYVHEFQTVNNEKIIGENVSYRTIEILDENAIITVPIMYSSNFIDKQYAKGNYNINSPEKVDFRLSELKVPDSYNFAIANKRAYLITEDDFMVSVLLEDKYTDNIGEISKEVNKFKETSVIYKEFRHSKDISTGIKNIFFVLAGIAGILFIYRFYLEYKM